MKTSLPEKITNITCVFTFPGRGVGHAKIFHPLPRPSHSLHVQEIDEHEVSLIAPARKHEVGRFGPNAEKIYLSQCMSNNISGFADESSTPASSSWLNSIST